MTPPGILFLEKRIFIDPISYTLGASIHAAKKTSIKHMGLCKVSSSRGMRKLKKNSQVRGGIDPGISRLGAQRLNHYATPDPLLVSYELFYETDISS